VKLNVVKYNLNVYKMIKEVSVDKDKECVNHIATLYFRMCKMKLLFSHEKQRKVMRVIGKSSKMLEMYK
jgi:hypothetical protein